MTDQTRHPMFNGVPILLGDTIEFANDPPSYDGTEAGVVSTIRMVRGEPWIHVTQADDPDRERNEVIYDHPTDKARGVIAHTPKEQP